MRNELFWLCPPPPLPQLTLVDTDIIDMKIGPGLPPPFLNTACNQN